MTTAPDGSIIVSWIESGESSEIRLATSTDGGRSFGPARLVDQGACPCCRTALAITGDGTAYIAWRKILDGEIRDIVVARVENDDTTPDRPRRAHADDWRLDACPHAGPALATDPADRLHLAWYTGGEGRAGLYYAATSDRAETFTQPTPILTGAGIPPSQVGIAVDEKGTIGISWEDRRAGDHGVRFARLRRDGTVGRALATPGTAPALAIAADGTAYIAWRKILDGEIRDIVVARVENDDTNPGQPRRAHADDWRLDACPHAGPALATDPADRLHLAWYTGEEGRAGLYYAVTSDRAETFTEPIPILTGAGIPPSQVGIAVDEKGIIGISWEDRRPRDQGVRFARLRRDGTVGRALAIPGTAPALAMAGGTTILAWLDGDSLRARFDW
jgi:hypothetical protein